MRKKRVSSKIIALFVVFTITLQMTADYSNTVFATEQNPVTMEDVKEGSEAGNTVGVTVEGVDGIRESTIQLGKIDTDTIKNKYDGYTFINATVGDVEISGVDKYNEAYYYYMNDVNSAYLLSDKKVVLHYRKVVNVFTVNYEYEAAIVNVVGEKTVKEGESISFRIELLDNQYRLASISANGAALVADQNGYCIIENASEDIAVVIAVEIIDKYKVSLDDRFINGINMTLKGEVEKGNEAWVTLGTIDTSFDSFNSIFVNGEYLNMETPMWEWENVITKETTLADGTRIRVTCSRDYNWADVKHGYIYTISAKNASSDLNFVPAIYRRHNISFLEIKGVQVYHWNGKELVIIPAGALIQKGNNTDIFFVDTQPGHDASANLSGEGSKVIEKISAISDVENVESGYKAARKAALAKGCDYAFYYSYIGKDDRTVKLASNLVDYKVIYDLNEGVSAQTIEDKTVYTIDTGKNIVEISDIIPTREGYTFDGWELVDTQAMYRANDEIVIDEALFNQLKSDKLELKAKWILDKDVKTSSYTVKHFFEREDGTYVEDENLTAKITNAPVSETAMAIPKEDISRYVYNPEVEGNKLVGKVTNDGNLTLKVYYSFQKNTVTYNSGTALSGSVPVDTASPYKTGSNVTVLANSGNLVGSDDAEFVCWSTNVEKTSDYYFPNDIIEIETNTVLYAVFAGDLLNSSTLSFTAGANGRLEGNTKFVVPANVTFGKVISDVSLLATAQADELYLFDGWYFANNKIASTNTELFNEVKDWNVSGEIEARFVENSELKHDISYTVNYYTGDTLKETEVVVDENVTQATKTLKVRHLDTSDDKFAGYSYATQTPIGIKDGDIVDNGATIQVYYVKDASKWTKVEFSAGTQGLLNDSMDSVISNDVLIGETFESQGIEMPTITANDGWLVADNEWDIAISNKTIIEKGLIVTAQYIKKEVTPVVPDNTPTMPTPRPTATTVVNTGIPVLFRTAPIMQNTRVQENVEIEDNKTPQVQSKVKVEDDKSALAKSNEQWSLFNLLFTIATVLLGMLILLSRIKNNDYADKTVATKRISKVVSGLVLLISITIFVFTQNMSTIMVAFDKWSVLMAALLMIQLGVMVFIRMNLKSHKKQTQTV